MSVDHYHLAVFHGPDDTYDGGVEIQRRSGQWVIVDTWALLGAEDLVHGCFDDLAAAVRSGLALLHQHFGDPVRPCWGAGAPNGALSQLGYSRPRLRWSWWPPRFRVIADVNCCIGSAGAPR